MKRFIILLSSLLSMVATVAAATLPVVAQTTEMLTDGDITVTLVHYTGEGRYLYADRWNDNGDTDYYFLEKEVDVRLPGDINGLSANCLRAVLVDLLAKTRGVDKNGTSLDAMLADAIDCPNGLRVYAYPAMPDSVASFNVSTSITVKRLSPSLMQFNITYYNNHENSAWPEEEYVVWDLRDNCRVDGAYLFGKNEDKAVKAVVSNMKRDGTYANFPLTEFVVNPYLTDRLMIDGRDLVFDYRMELGAFFVKETLTPEQYLKYLTPRARSRFAEMNVK